MLKKIYIIRYCYRDENGGVPSVHITEILGASQLYINQALAAGALAYNDEPKSGTMSEVNKIFFYNFKYY